MLSIFGPNFIRLQRARTHITAESWSFITTNITTARQGAIRP